MGGLSTKVQVECGTVPCGNLHTHAHMGHRLVGIALRSLTVSSLSSPLVRPARVAQSRDGPIVGDSSFLLVRASSQAGGGPVRLLVTGEVKASGDMLAGRRQRGTDVERACGSRHQARPRLWRGMRVSMALSNQRTLRLAGWAGMASAACPLSQDEKPDRRGKGIINDT